VFLKPSAEAVDGGLVPLKLDDGNGGDGTSGLQGCVSGICLTGGARKP